ncbi:MAG TPA: amidohydrolase family protein [Longimicrobium sp.]|nr:amidohydrolase family protein [Longimicrobium sp.]
MKKLSEPRDSRNPPFDLHVDGAGCVAVRDGRITAEPAPGSFSVRLGPGVILPGLINAHDHLFLNHFPRLGRPPYANVYEWADDVQGRLAGEVRRYRALPRRDAYLFGALKNLVGGVTSVVHHDSWHPEGEALPVRVLRVRVVHSLGLEADVEQARRGDAGTEGRPLCLHLAEGVDARAFAEVEEAVRRGLLGPGTLAVHVIAASGADAARLRESGTAVVWCPTSNLHLYGRTLLAGLAGSGVDVLLGTDSLLSGAGTLLDELRAARVCHLLDDAALLDAVGATAARRLGVAPPSLAPGATADLCFFRRPPLEARPADVALVVVDGRPRYGDAEFAELFARARVEVDVLEVGGVAKLVEAPLGQVARRVLDLSPECARIFGA